MESAPTAFLPHATIYPRLAPPRALLASRLTKIGLIGNFPPRRCGLATFTADIRDALAGAVKNLRIDVVAIDDPIAPCAFGSDVAITVPHDDIAAYAAAGEALNRAEVEMICVQHEFGIFGGPAGAHLLTLLATADAPVVTTFHTILAQPNDEQRTVMRALIRRSARLVAMSARGAQMLVETYGADPLRIDVIPHGAPDMPAGSPAEAKREFGFEGRRILLTFGLLGPNKGLESVIRAMPEIVALHPDTDYVILGATHPHLIRREGERYRDSLQALAFELNVAANVRFIDAYVDKATLLRYLRAADIYVTPYLNEAQITSGTLAYAVALGKAVVSTPYWHAKDLLQNGVGVLVGFGDTAGFARALNGLLSDGKARARLEANAFAAGRETIWPAVGKSYAASLQAAKGAKLAPAEPAPRPRVEPAPSLQALVRMSDSCGIFQHARHLIPDRAHGYCVDDNARALILAESMRALGLGDPETVARLATTYASFLDHAWNADAGRFRNFMSYDRTWLESFGSDDSNGRSLWALALTARLTRDPDLKEWSLGLARRAGKALSQMRSLRALAFCVLAADAGLEAAPGEPVFTHLLQCGAETLRLAMSREVRPDWIWPERVLGYDNARLPQAMLLAGRRLDDARLTKLGLAALQWLSGLQTNALGHFRPVGNESFHRPYERPLPFDQQPVEAHATIAACWTAFQITGDERWPREAERAFRWFFGENDLLTALATPDGGCFDAVNRVGVNRNQGAESILALQLSHCEMLTGEASRRAALG